MYLLLEHHHLVLNQNIHFKIISIFYNTPQQIRNIIIVKCII